MGRPAVRRRRGGDVRADGRCGARDRRGPRVLRRGVPEKDKETLMEREHLDKKVREHLNKKEREPFRRAALLTLALLAAPRIALACPVCFGNSDAPMAK